MLPPHQQQPYPQSIQVNKNKSTTISFSVLSAALLVSCTDSEEAQFILTKTEYEQRQAQLVCQAEQGIHIPEAVHALRLKDGRVIVTTHNGPGITLAQARTINSCAATKLLSGAELDDVSLLPTSHSVSPKVETPSSQAQPPSLTNFGCVKGGGVMQGGTSICPKGR